MTEGDASIVDSGGGGEVEDNGDRDHASEGVHVKTSVLAKVQVNFFTICDVRVQLHEGEQQRKMVRCYGYTFSGQIDKGDNLEWRIAEVKSILT